MLTATFAIKRKTFKSVLPPYHSHQYSRTYHKCQIYADKVHIPPVPLNVLTTPWPFTMWGIDMIGEIKPTTSNGLAMFETMLWWGGRNDLKVLRLIANVAVSKTRHRLFFYPKGKVKKHRKDL